MMVDRASVSEIIQIDIFVKVVIVVLDMSSTSANSVMWEQQCEMLPFI